MEKTESKKKLDYTHPNNLTVLSCEEIDMYNPYKLTLTLSKTEASYLSVKCTDKFNLNNCIGVSFFELKIKIKNNALENTKLSIRFISKEEIEKDKYIKYLKIYTIAHINKKTQSYYFKIGKDKLNQKIKEGKYSIDDNPILYENNKFYLLSLINQDEKEK